MPWVCAKAMRSCSRAFLRRDDVVKPLLVSPLSPAPDVVHQAARWVTGGGLLVFPTDTLYGLGAHPSSDAALAALFQVKGRDDRAAVPLIAASVDHVAGLSASWGGLTAALASRFWPGPLSLVIDAPESIASAVHGGRGTIAVRVPNQPVARAVAAAVGGLVTATSANRSGQPAAASVGDLDDVVRDPRVLVLDAGPLPGGAPSTIVDARGAEPVLIREGAIPFAALLAALSDGGFPVRRSSSKISTTA